MKSRINGIGIGLILFMFFDCNQGKESAVPLGGPKTAAPKAFSTKDPDRDEMKGLTMEAIQREGRTMEIPPGAIEISPERQQLIAIRFGKVEKRPVNKVIRTVGRIGYDETRLFTVSPKVGGWIEELYADFTGKKLNRGEPLLTIYSPELVSAQEEYLIALRAARALKGGEGLVDSARRRLRLWDISDDQIKALEETGRIRKTLTLHSPFDGFVLERMAYPGMNVSPGMALYKLADLSSVWIYADIYESEIPFIRLGQEAMIQLSYEPGKYLKGQVKYIYPYFDAVTRTGKVRFEFANPKGLLKPEMYANVEIRIPLGIQLVVPEGAIIDTGLRKVAIIDLGFGYFEPRDVKLGMKVENDYIVLGGLKEGERVVTSANFLVDSESKFKEAAAGMGMPGIDHGAHGK